jgi:cytochrome b
MGLLVVVAFLVVLAVFGITGWFVVDSRDSRDWQPMDWPTGRRRL